MFKFLRVFESPWHSTIKLLSQRSTIKQQVFWINETNLKSNIKIFFYVLSHPSTLCIPYSNATYEIKTATVRNIGQHFIPFHAWSSIVIFLCQRKVASISYRFNKLFHLCYLSIMRMCLSSVIFSQAVWKIFFKFEINLLRHDSSGL